MARGTDDNQWVALISKVAPFSYLSEDEVLEISDSFTWFTALGGKTLIHQNDPSDELFIVVSGALGFTSAPPRAMNASSDAFRPARWSARWD